MPDSPIQLNRELSTPVFRQIYERYREAISQGRLRPGDRVPSVRSLAAELGIARGTVEAAYALLCGEGFFVARGQGGTVVAPQLLGHTHEAATAPPNAPGLLPKSTLADTPALPFQLGLPALDAFPRKLWARLGARRWRALSQAHMAYPDTAGYAPLREAVATYLGVSRGIRCTPAQVFITQGYRGSLDLVWRTLMQPGDTVLTEDPGFFQPRQLLAAAGAQLVPVPVDAEGIQVAIGLQRVPQARLAVVTPSHQSPLAVSLSLPRRLELLHWATRQAAWILEDDYDGEYRYQGRPLPALKSLDHAGRVLYAGTFSKVLFPAIRLAYLVVPETQVDAFARTARIFHNGSPLLMQQVVTDFMTAGHFSLHLRKMRQLYAARRTHVAAAFNQVFEGRLHIDLQAGGMHLLARLNSAENDKILAARANKHGLALQALSNWMMEPTQEQGLLLGFTNVASPEEALELTERLGNAWGG